jgi:hypothetical protein
MTQVDTVNRPLLPVIRAEPRRFVPGQERNSGAEC